MRGRFFLIQTGGVVALRRCQCRRRRKAAYRVGELGHVQWLDGCRLYVSRIAHTDDRTDNLYNGVSVWLSASYLIYSRHMKRGDQTCEMDLCVLLCGIHETIICVWK